MNRRVVTGSLAGLAAIALATGGSTLAAFDAASDVPTTTVGAGVLQVHLGERAALGFSGLMPGDRDVRRVWVAGNDRSSTQHGTLAVRIDRLRDSPAPCDTSTGKAAGELASGIGGCTIAADGTVTGTPDVGTASRLLDVRLTYDGAAHGASDCAGRAAGDVSLLPVQGAGDLRALASAGWGAGTVVPVRGGDGRPLVLAPGQGVCLTVSAAFPPGTTSAGQASPEHPVDDAAQGDALAVDVTFVLTQVGSTGDAP